MQQPYYAPAQEPFYPPASYQLMNNSSYGTNIGLRTPNLKMPQASLPGQRRRLNVVGIAVSFLVPWGLFTLIFLVAGSRFHYEHSGWYDFFLVITALPIGLTLMYVAKACRRKVKEPGHQHTWIFFVCFTMLVAWLAAFFMGSSNFRNNFKPVYDIENLNNYTDIYTNRIRGQQIMDAGMIRFAPGTTLDVEKAMGFQNNAVYCVAPITFGTEDLITYDFWAVGTNCCDGEGGAYRCGAYDNENANGGLRLVRDWERPLYRLAVQQAESRYNIKATHPLFFRWVTDPEKVVQGWWDDGIKQNFVAVMGYALFQGFLVATASIAFARLGQLALG